MDNLKRMKVVLEAQRPGGFYDSVATRSGTVAEQCLSLDQGIIIGVLGNVLGKDLLHRAFSSGDVKRTVRPLLAMEEFGAGYAAGRPVSP